MTSFAFFSGVNGPQNLSDNETGYLGRDAAINGQINYSGGDMVDITIHGTAYNATGSAIYMLGSDLHLFVGTTGTVTSTSNQPGSYFAALSFLAGTNTGPSNSYFTNFGELSGPWAGLLAGAYDTDDTLYAINGGGIHGNLDGIYLGGTGSVVLTNSGTISGLRNGIWNDSGDTRLDLLNSGVIHGGEEAISVGASADTIINRGRLEGDVLMGGGADLFDNRGGAIDGDIDLGPGQDIFIGNPNVAETVNGGSDSDLLDFRFGAGAIVALDQTVDADGAAIGDTYSGFERIFGSRVGADVLRGNAAANTLLGNGGADTLDGSAGSDYLRGGRDADILTGGAGNDNFVMLFLNEIGDTITDFSSTGAGNNDRITVSTSFGGGLSAGQLAASQFRSRADNAAQDADDRFIFRTTDQTLWFDADGNGATAAVMVADLQAGATMTSFDIFVV